MDNQKTTNKISVLIFTDSDLDSADLMVKSLISLGGGLIDSILVYNYDADDNSASNNPFKGECLYLESKSYDFLGFPTVINAYAREINSESDILVLCKTHLITPNCLERLSEALHTYDNAGMAVPHMNTRHPNQAIPKDIKDYKAASEFALNVEGYKLHRITLGDQRAFLIKHSTFDKLGGFNEDMKSLNVSYADFLFRIIMEKENIVAVPGALMWNLCPESEEPLLDKMFDGASFDLISKIWGIGYYNHGGNLGIENLIDKDLNESFRVLEVGCSKGDTLLEINDKYPNSEVFGVELDEKAAKLAENFCKVICANIEDEDLPYEDNFFDYIILADVLEHLRNPKRALEYLRRFLKDGGYVLASIPNVQHISVVRELLKGNFTYTNVGLLDHTHIHLFTWNEISRMFTACGLKTGVFGYTNFRLSDEERICKKQLLENVDCSDAFMFEAYQYVFKAEKIKDFELKEDTVQRMLGKKVHKCRICGAEGDFESYLTREMMKGIGDEFEYFECAECGCLQIADIPENPGKYRDEDYYRYDAENISKIIFKKPAVNHFKVLDVGCGGGHWLLSLAVGGHDNLFGCDDCLENDFQYGDRVSIKSCSIHEMDGDGSFDVIHIGNHFEQITDPLETLKSAARLLKQGGSIELAIATYPNALFDVYGPHWCGIDAPRRITLHSRDSIAYLAKEAGLTVKEYRYDSAAKSCYYSFFCQNGIPSSSVTQREIERFVSSQMREDASILTNRANRTFTGDHMSVFLVKQ